MIQYAQMNVCGNWRLEREIGRGAYGVVYIAANGKGERAAVKVCRRDEIGEERYARELRGAKLYSAIPPQEGLVRMRELAEEPWGFYAVMDLADNEFTTDASYRPKTLASVIAGVKALPLGECIKLGIALAKGLAALQRHHLLHRDIKPGNVIYVGGRPVLTDPGLVVEEDKAASLVGTPGYVPPEKNFTDAASDIYSLGLTLKAASFGRSVEDLDKGPSPEADTGAGYFPAWWRILNKATDEEHSRRYQSARALLKDLKLLGVKIALPSVRIVVLSVIAMVGLAVAAIFVPRAMSVNDYVKEMEKRERDYTKEAKRDIQWVLLRGGPSNIAEIWGNNLRWRIERVATTNKTQAAELQSLADKMLELGKNEESLAKEINSLSKHASQNRQKGLSDKKEFQRASKLNEEREKVSAAWRAIHKEILSRLGEKEEE